MSNSLQLALAATGGVILLGLMAHNAWTAHKSHPRQPDPVAPQPATRQLPDSDANADAKADANTDAKTGTLPANAPADSTDDASLCMIPADLATPGLHGGNVAEKNLIDALIDAIAPIELDADAQVSGEAAIAALPASRRVGDKSFAIEGRNAHTGAWEMPQAGQMYDAFQAGVQLANRAGALNEIGFSEFTLKAQAFADDVNGTAHFPDMIEEVARARELDQFATTNDARLRYVLRARGAAWSAGYLQQVAARHGFIAGSLPGRMVLPASSAGMPPVLSLEFDTQAALAENLDQSAICELFLCLDLPQITANEQPFERMCAIAQQLSKEMDGTIIDGNGYRIDPVAMQSIGKDVQDLYLLLEQRDFVAGSVLARRLFS